VLTILPHGDVLELRFTTWRSRLINYAVSTFVTRDVMIDAAFAGVAGELGAWLAAHPLAGAIVTHAHEDHSGNVGLLAARGIPVQMAGDTERRLRTPERIGLYRRWTWGARHILTHATSPFTHDALALRPAPGHSADHHVVWDRERGTVFGGDLFIGVKVRIAHHDEDLRRQVRTLRAIADIGPERFFDAHRGKLEDPVAQLRAKADWIEETIAAIEERVRAGMDDTAIRTAVLGPEDLTGRASFGDYSRLNFVRSVRRSMAAAPSAERPAGA
jgi:ribonuclease/clavin/mitogillin